MGDSISRRDLVRAGAGLTAGIVLGMKLVGCTERETLDVDASGEVTDTRHERDETPGEVVIEERDMSSSTSSSSLVYFTRHIDQEGLLNAYKALSFDGKGRIGIKFTTGEPGGKNFLKPSFVEPLVSEVKGIIVECNTAYGGRRSTTESHYRVAEEHGFTSIAEVDIMDDEGEKSIPVDIEGILAEMVVGSHVDNYDHFISLAHFKGHSMAGFGGAIKNIAIGMASSSGKLLIHSGGRSRSSWQSASQEAFLEAMAEAVLSVISYAGPIPCVNVMNRLSVDCDCDSYPAEPDMGDIGILSSWDPVALDQACVDKIYAAQDGSSVRTRIESRNGIHTLEYGDMIGLGNRSYELIDLDA